ncbi:MAG TPA: hypothetical protein VE988_24520 [Gemmataceae bacterium]|nr:hypothetical protein [Gemmataceae bacterium]
MTVASVADPRLHSAVRSCVQALRQIAAYTLPAVLDEQLRELGERKEFLQPSEHNQLMALVGFTQQRTVEKLQAELALQKLQAIFPEEFQA